MKFSLWTGLDQPWSDVLDVAAQADAGSWHRLYVSDHLMAPAPGGLLGAPLECWASLSALAASTTRVGLGTLVCANTFRHPSILAKTAATVDVISGGRVLLGLGAGWQADEHTAFGLDIGTVVSRMDRLDEASQIITGLVRTPPLTFSGEHYAVSNASIDPAPIGPLHLMIGGGGEKRTLRAVARWADEWNVWSTPEQFAAKLKVLAAHCDAVGRDVGTIARSTQAMAYVAGDEATTKAFRDSLLGSMAVIAGTSEMVELMGAYRDAGVDEFIVMDLGYGRGEQRRDAISRWRDDVFAGFV
jgi:F420-dependent oxidoreductase-like protein